MSRTFTPQRRELTALRLAAQGIGDRGDSAAGFDSPASAVRHLLAVQAQDFPGAKWTVGLRVPGATDAAIERALAEREIVRSWPMRGTLHFVAPEDLGWMLRVTAPRLITGLAKRHRDLELSDRDFEVAREAAHSALSGNRTLQRDALLAVFAGAGVHTTGQRGSHLLMYLSQTRDIVFAQVEGKQQTFALLDEWVTAPRQLDGDEALAEFALRYFVSHGPATVRDLA